MQHAQSCKTYGRHVLTVLALAWTATCWAAPPYSDAAPMALRGVMEDLGEQVAVVAAAIAHEDWARVQQAAALIADHPEPPPQEKAPILKLLGGEAQAFRGHDRKAAAAARTMSEAAARADGQGVIDAFHTVQSSCHGCHQQFRERLLGHFYGAR